MSLVVVGLSHHTSPLALRERLAFRAQALPGALLQLRKRLDGGGCVILSTCNRVEVYAHHDVPPEALTPEVTGFLCETHGLPMSMIEEALYMYTDRDAVGHLFRVTSSLDSMVVGEGQILGQVHDAFLAAQAEQTADKVIHALFQRAFAVAKKTRTQTSISAGKVSIGSVAVDLAASVFMNLEDKTVLIVGSGKMGESTLRALLSRGARRVIISNRKLEKAQALAEEHRGVVVPFEQLEAELHQADIVITSTAAPGYVLAKPAFQAALRKRNQEPMFVIDIAVPRDVDPAVNDLDDVYLYDVDDLRQVADENLAARRQEVARCMELVEEGVDQFMRWWRALAAEPTIVSLAEELNAIREAELTKTYQRLPELPDTAREEIDYLTQRIVNTILQRPMSQLKQEMVRDDSHSILHVVKRLFGLKETT